MDTYPLDQLDLAGAQQFQFRLVEDIARHFDGHAILQAGDYGLWAAAGRPHFTARVEAVLADFFSAEDACLVRGAGTGALRGLLIALLKPGQPILLHRAPIYPTTAITMEAMGLKPVYVDLNDLEALQSRRVGEVEVALVQHTRQRLEDRYRLDEVIRALKSQFAALTIIVDDNYAAMRVPRIGVQLGADISTFSLFKLLGPEGLGVALGKREIVQKIRRQHYSGGSQVQGVEAMQALRALTLAPLALAVQAEVVAEVARRLNAGEVAGVKRAYIANAQSRVVLVELEKPQSGQILEKSVQYGAASHPVGAESRYEVAPLFYQVSGALQAEHPGLASIMIRINPMRAGADLILEILRKALKDCEAG